MAIEADDEILQDFLVEAGEILEQLGEQLVELEQRPQDADLLNAVFRGFHTVKGGAGFLALHAMVAVCHRAEDVFNILRQGDRILDPGLMDMFLRVLDILHEQFAQITNGQDPSEADPELLESLEKMAVPASEDPQEAAAPVAEEAPPETPEPVEIAAADSGGDITDEEFEALLDAMQAGGNAPQTGKPATAKPKAKSSKAKPAAKTAAKTTKGKKAAPRQEASKEESGDEISDDEFENLLDQLHGKGKAPTVAADAEQKAAKGAAEPEHITDDEFEALLDQLHGEGKSPTEGAKPATAPAAPAQAAPPPAAKAATTAAVAQDKNVATAKQPPKIAAETTVRVDTKRLDDIMNMVGELVLVRNRLHTLKEAMNDEQVSKAVANLDIVTSDLQAAVMKTRMQPIKKVFGRFPRVVRDLARSLKKEVDLELVGEETDLDKNLVEALADPLVHLVRNSVDHGIEMPDGQVSLQLEDLPQGNDEGDHHGHPGEDGPRHEVGREDGGMPPRDDGHGKVPGHHRVNREDQGSGEGRQKDVRLPEVMPFPVGAPPPHAHHLVQPPAPPRGLVPGRRHIRNRSQVEEDRRDSEVRRDGEDVPEKRRAEIGPQETGVGIGDQPIPVPHASQVDEGEKSCRHDGEDRHGLGGPVDGLSPRCPEEEENGRYECARVSDSHPED